MCFENFHKLETRFYILHQPLLISTENKIMSLIPLQIAALQSIYMNKYAVQGFHQHVLNIMTKYLLHIRKYKDPWREINKTLLSKKYFSLDFYVGLQYFFQ